jgi:hypothetical protein
MKPAEDPETVSIVVELHERPRYILDLRLEITWVFQLVTKPEEQFGLHAANEVRQFLIGSPASTQASKSMPDAGIWLSWIGLSPRDRFSYPRGIVLRNDGAPCLAQEKKPRQLRNTFLELRCRPTFGISSAQLFEDRAQSLSIHDHLTTSLPAQPFIRLQSLQHAARSIKCKKGRVGWMSRTWRALLRLACAHSCAGASPFHAYVACDSKSDECAFNAYVSTSSLGPKGLRQAT